MKESNIKKSFFDTNQIPYSSSRRLLGQVCSSWLRNIKVDLISFHLSTPWLEPVSQKNWELNSEKNVGVRKSDFTVKCMLKKQRFQSLLETGDVVIGQVSEW